METDYTGAQLSAAWNVLRRQGFKLCANATDRCHGTRSTLMVIVPDSFMLAPPRPAGEN